MPPGDQLADDAFTALLVDALAGPATRSPSTTRRPGTAWRSSRAPASRTSSRASRAGRASRTGGARRVGHLRRDPHQLVYVPNGRVPGSEHYPYKLEWLASLREMSPPAGGADRPRRHEHRAVRRRRVRPRRLHRPDARDRARAGGAGRARGRSACTTSCASAGRASACSPTGTTGPACPPGPGHADRPRARQRRRLPTASRPRGSTGRPARAPGRAITRRSMVDLDEAPDGDIGPVVPPPSAPVTAARREEAAAGAVGPVDELRLGKERVGRSRRFRRQTTAHEVDRRTARDARRPPPLPHRRPASATRRTALRSALSGLGADQTSRTAYSAACVRSLSRASRGCC